MEKKSKKNIIIGLTCLFLATILLIGLTYAYFRTKVIGNDKEDPSISGISKLAEITYQDGSSEMNMAGFIEPGFEASKTFYVENTGNQSIKYSIMIEDMNNTFERNQDWTWTLTENGTKIEEGILAVGTHQLLSGSRTIAETKGTVNTYVFTLKYENSPENQSIDMGETLSFKITIAEEQYTWDEAPQGSLLYALKTNQPSGSVNISLESAMGLPPLKGEPTIITSEDDYGTSHIYKGAVINNYVNYSGMCWRILRVQGDGTIKLILADEDNECDSTLHSINNCDSANINNSKSYMYSDIIDLEHYYYKNSNIPSILLEWMNKEVKNADGSIIREKNLDSSKLIVTDWCNDMSIASESGYGLDNNGNYVYTKEEATKEWWPTYNYGASERLLKEEPSPTLKCNMKGINNSEADRIENIIGIITADEIVFADVTSNDSPSSYLVINALPLGFSMTPYNYHTMASSELFALIQGSIGKVYNTDFISAIRPVIALRNDVLATYDTNSEYAPGTYQNPYNIS